MIERSLIYFFGLRTAGHPADYTHGYSQSQDNRKFDISVSFQAMRTDTSSSQEVEVSIEGFWIYFLLSTFQAIC